MLLVTSISQPCSCLFLRGASSTCTENTLYHTHTQRTSSILAQQSVLTGNYLCNHTNAACDDGSFCLSSAHAPQARGHKDTATQVIRAQVPPAGVQHSQLHGRTQGHGWKDIRAASKVYTNCYDLYLTRDPSSQVIYVYVLWVHPKRVNKGLKRWNCPKRKKHWKLFCEGFYHLVTPIA